MTVQPENQKNPFIQECHSAFERLRPRLFGLAYRMLGMVADAEDVVQDAYVRWHDADHSAIRSHEAWLVAVTTRLSIDRRKRALRERATYIGDWLPEPVATQAPSATDRNAETVSDLSMAFLVLLERLSPDERAVFLLRDVFDTEYADIAEIIGKRPEACRQMVRRARARVRDSRARFTVATEIRERLVSRFLAAIQADDQDALLALVSADATWTSDSDGRVSATRRVIHGAVNITRLVLGLEHKGRGLVRHEMEWINGEPSIATYFGNTLMFTTSMATDGEQLVAFYRVMNPGKLRHAGSR